MVPPVNDLDCEFRRLAAFSLPETRYTVSDGVYLVINRRVFLYTMAYLLPTSLPASLWRDERYHVAGPLHATYVEQLTSRNLIQLAISDHKNKQIYGGESVESTDEHFALRFAASVVRLQNVILDTQAKFDRIPSDIITMFSSHKLSMLDIPCGTGAGGLGLLSIIHELRIAGILPTLPLTVQIVAGDVSEHAMEIYEKQMDALRPVLKTTGIIVDLALYQWNAIDLLSTSRLCEKWEQTGFEADEAFVLATNFSGAGTQLLEQFKESFRHICARAATKTATVLWIEPGTSGGLTFLEKSSKYLKSLFGFVGEDGHKPPFSEAKWWHALINCELPVRSAVHHYTPPQ